MKNFVDAMVGLFRMPRGFGRKSWQALKWQQSPIRRIELRIYCERACVRGW